jgi:hypothetical protein
MAGVDGPLQQSWKNEWRVTPPALMAATPVGAVTIIRLAVFPFRFCRKVVFPVPAFPVKKYDCQCTGQNRLLV